MAAKSFNEKTQMLLEDEAIMPSYQCECGNPAKFFKLETGTHQCE